MERKNQSPSQEKQYSTASNAGKPFPEKQVPSDTESMTGRKPNQPVEEESDDYADEEIETNKDWK